MLVHLPVAAVVQPVHGQHGRSHRFRCCILYGGHVSRRHRGCDGAATTTRQTYHGGTTAPQGLPCCSRCQTAEGCRPPCCSPRASCSRWSWGITPLCVSSVQTMIDRGSVGPLRCWRMWPHLNFHIHNKSKCYGTSQHIILCSPPHPNP